MHDSKYIINDSTGHHIMTLEYRYLPDVKETKVPEIVEKHGFQIQFGVSTDKVLMIERLEEFENKRDKEVRASLIAMTNELNTYFLSLDSIMFNVVWQQHDEDGFPSQRRDENLYGYSEKEVWKQAYCEGEHETDYLISIDGISREDLKRQGLI